MPGFLARRRSHRAPWGAAAALAWVGGGCGGDVGTVEVAWVVAGRDGEPIFPSGDLAPSAYDDTCDLPGYGPGMAEVTYALRLSLQICDPGCGDCSDSACHVVPEAELPCDGVRYTDPDVPASERPYLFRLRARIETETGSCVPSAGCVVVPGPISRKVRPGRVTDLQVVEILLDVEGGARPGSPASRLDLVACGCA
ncbi:MAG: hypothetical protein D6705_10070 [Deltaproteobacteria bacterium]|nr:MAG: hypothetical protein D6705_10070 [Deltaproteobacteria bacterium]